MSITMRSSGRRGTYRKFDHTGGEIATFSKQTRHGYKDAVSVMYSGVPMIVFLVLVQERRADSVDAAERVEAVLDEELHGKKGVPVPTGPIR